MAPHDEFVPEIQATNPLPHLRIGDTKDAFSNDVVKGETGCPDDWCKDTISDGFGSWCPKASADHSNEFDW
jgi:hypothetical protein